MTNPTETPVPSPVERIRELNDAFRRDPAGRGRVVMTVGVASGPIEQQLRVLEAVRTFEVFTRKNDPFGEHDFGAFEVDGIRHFWKIDYYDQDGIYGSPDPADPEVTQRVLTIMHVSEY